jgi:cupin fold WbuC family metalloprotein
MSKATEVDVAMIQGLLAEAKAVPRQRKNLNFHDYAGHPCQRLLNAMLPGSYVRPHRHTHENKDEFMIVVSGCMGIVLFDENGAVTLKTKLEEGGPVRAISIPAGVFHTCVALAPTVIFEAKAGPYLPNTADEVAQFAPAEGAPEAADFVRRMEVLLAQV